MIRAADLPVLIPVPDELPPPPVEAIRAVAALLLSVAEAQLTEEHEHGAGEGGDQ